MKLVTFVGEAGEDRLGAWIDDSTKVVDLAAADETINGTIDPFFDSMLDLIEGGEEALEAAYGLIVDPPENTVLPTGEVTLRTPVPAPPQIRDCLCFEEHLTQAFAILRKVKAAAEPDPEAAMAEFERQGLFRIPEVWYQQPIYYKGNRFSVVGTDADVIWPTYADILDYEMEFGFFVGKGGKNISKDNAQGHIFGYSIFNDISARDVQTVEMPGGLGPAKSKDFDTGNVIGPCIVTADEIDPYDLDLIVRVNGEERSRGNSSSIHWKFEDLIAHISQSETIYPGEFIASGTVGGGSGLELERYLEPGDVVELEVEGIGTIRNKIVRP
ncbi:MAG: fumarylacetoacetate hydrolase family protein [Proteobacteria bacterium]|nr:fumarylacetoacetate hydrolase family protein [Pseudomonadota bacterium]